MKTLDKKEKSDCSASDDSPPQRPKRNACQKSLGTNGLLWREETDLKKALYASLQENKRKNWDEDGEEENPDDEEEQTEEPTEGIVENGVEESPKKAKVHAQRKFAQGSTPSSPAITPQKVPAVNSTTQLLPYKRPKTEDFLTFLCLRGTSILPPSLDFLNNCSKSDTSSECRSLSPDLEECVAKDNVRNGTIKEKHKHEVVENGISRKVGACRASSKTSPPVKKLNFSSSKLNKMVLPSKKNKLQIEKVDPQRLKASSKAKPTALNALKEKYKKQRLAADKKKLIPAKSPSTSAGVKKNISQKSRTKTPPVSSKNVHSKKYVKVISPIIHKSKLTRVEKKLAVEKRKSLRSADIRPRRLASLKKKTPWIRRAKLVPPIVDVESDSSEPEVISTAPAKKVPATASALKKLSKPQNVCDRLRSKVTVAVQSKHRLTARQILLRKHMQNRLKNKKTSLHSKNIRSRTIVKRTAKQAILKKVKKSLVIKTMSLRKDHQNKRVTRSAKHQIEEMLWSNPEKRARGQNQKPAVPSKPEKKKLSIENSNVLHKRLKPSTSNKDKELVKTSKDSNKEKEVIKVSKSSVKEKEVIKVSKSSVKEKEEVIKAKGSNKEKEEVMKTKTSNKEKEEVMKIKNINKEKEEVIKTSKSCSKEKEVLKTPKSSNKDDAVKFAKSSSKEKEEVIKTSKSSNKEREVGKIPKSSNKEKDPIKSPKGLNKEKEVIKASKNCNKEKEEIVKASKGSNKDKEEVIKASKGTDKDKEEVIKTSKSSKDALKRKPLSTSSNDNSDKTFKRSVSPKLPTLSNPAKISRRSLSREEKPGPSSAGKTDQIKTDRHTSTSKITVNNQKQNVENGMTSSEIKLCKLPNLSDSKKESKNATNTVSDNGMTPKPSTSEASIVYPKNTDSLKINSISFSNQLSNMNVKVNLERDAFHKFEFKEKEKNDTCSASGTNSLSNDKNVQNNLNLIEPEKTSNKDISSLIVLNVNLTDTQNQNSEPSCSGINQNIKEKNVHKVKDILNSSVKEINLTQEHKVHKKSHDKKSSKKDKIIKTSKEEKLKRSGDKEKLIKKSEKGESKSPKKHKDRRSSKDIDVNSEVKKNSHKKDLVKSKADEMSHSDIKKNYLKSGEKKNKMEKAHFDSHNSKNEKYHRDINRERSPGKNGKQINNECKVSSVQKELNFTENKKLNTEVFAPTCSNKIASSMDVDKKEKCDIHLPSTSKDLPRNVINSSSKETDDDSDYDLTLDQIIKLNELKTANKFGSQTITPVKEESSNVKINHEGSKDVKPKKEHDKDSHKSKKDGESSKHKKDKESSKSKSHDKDQKTPKKEDKSGKKDPEKALAKLLKKEREKDKSKSSKKEEKSKHKKESSSSKSSKKDSDKDSSKSIKKDSEASINISNIGESSLEHSESKKDKFKKEFKLSRSSSCDDTKSPKKKKKHNELKDIEKIKNLISNSSILNEISGFKEYKRRSSSDKAELKKSKKRKKLALLKEKKLSKKLSSKLLRKYSKKKGLKSKKNKLKKKELKEMKIAGLDTKLLSKSKKQKHKTKNDHHDKGEKIKNIEESTMSLTTSKTLISSTGHTAQFFAQVTESECVSYTNTTSDVISNSQSCTTSSSSVPAYIIESVPEGIHTVEAVSTQIPQSVTAPAEQYLIGTTDGIVASEYTGVFDETFPTGAILLATRDTISQVPVHFIQDISIPKTMADAATDTGEDDLEETLKSEPDIVRSDEMSVGTQTMSPVCSPIPTVEIQPLVLPMQIKKESSAKDIVKNIPKTPVPSVSIPPISLVSKTPVSPVSLIPVSSVSIIPVSSASKPPVSPVSNSPVSFVSTPPVSLVSTPPASPLVSTPPASLVSIPPTSLVSTPPTSLVSTPPASLVSNPPASLVSNPPVPLVSNSPVPLVSNSPVPLVSNSPVPLVSNSPVPLVSNSPVPLASTPSVSLASTPSVSLASTLPVSLASTLPVSLVSNSHVSLVSNSHVSLVSNSHVSLVSNSPDSLVSKTPVPPVSKTVPYVSPVKVPEKTVAAVTPSKSIPSNVTNESASTSSSSPKPKRRTSVVKKFKAQSIVLPKGQPFPIDSAKLVTAPVYYPTAEEFKDPLEYIYKIQGEAAQFGICKIIPPSSFKPECKVNDDMRFTAHNQYLHKMLNRWGPNVQHTACIKKHLKSQKVKLDQAPLIGGIELDISRFYHTVQQYGGLQQVIEKKKWQRVADALRVPKTAQDRVTKLYDAYCRYLVSFDALPLEEKEKLREEVAVDHEKRVKLRNSANDSEKEDEDLEEENTECVSKGRSMSLSNFFRIARNTMNMWFKNSPSPDEVEHEYWKIVMESQQHIVVHAGNIDSSVYQSGFACNRNSPFAKHPWNLKILTNNSSSILRCMGPVSGITIPTLHVGMLFTTGCWYRDPHSLPWIEYLHTGASKIWYSIPAKGCEKFRQGMKKIMPECCTNNPIWLPSDTAMVPPDMLVKHGASLSRTIQNSGQFVVIFPESFTSTICCGYCVSESVYFAPTSWLNLAVKAFQDIQSSCEPPAFSLERLLLCIANEPKTQLETLQKILPLIQNIRIKEVDMRTQLSELGLKQLERLPQLDTKDKKKKSKVEEECEQECEVCRSHCYVSMVFYSQEESIYCLPHALEHIPKKNLKLCKLMYTYDESELKELENKILEFIATHQVKLSAKKKSPKKKLTPVAEK